MPDFTHSHNRALFKHAVLMIAVGTAICALGSLMARPSDQLVGYVVASAFVAGYLVIGALHPELRKLCTFSRRIAIPFIAAGLALMCYAAFSTLESDPLDLRIMGLLCGLLGLFWAAWYLMLAFRFQPRTPQAVGLTAVAAANSLLSVVLAARPEPSRLSVVTVCGAFVIVLGVQIFLTAVLLHRELMREPMTEIL